MQTQSWKDTATNSVTPGVLAGATISLAAAACGRRDSGSALAPLNATSHIVWGDAAAQVEQPTWRHTGLGLALAGGSAIFWAAIFEKLFGRAIDRRGAGAALAGAATTAGIAYLTDYHVVPRRLTPGYEKRVSRRSMFYLYGALALGLSAGALLQRRARSG